MFRTGSRLALAIALAVPLLGGSIHASTAGGTPGERTEDAVVTEADEQAAGEPGALRMWYTEPVENWENEALVQGNGSTGLQFGGRPSGRRLAEGPGKSG